MGRLEKFKILIPTGINIWTEQHYKPDEPIIYVYCERDAYEIFYKKYIKDHLKSCSNLGQDSQVIVNSALTRATLGEVYHYNSPQNNVTHKRFYFLDSKEQLFTNRSTLKRKNIHYTRPYSVFNHFLNQQAIKPVCQQILKEHFYCNEKEEGQYFDQFWKAYQTFQKEIALPLMKTIIQKYKSKGHYNTEGIELKTFLKFDKKLNLWYAPNLLDERLSETPKNTPPSSVDELPDQLLRQLIVGFFELYFKALAKKLKVQLGQSIEDLLCKTIHPTHYFPPSLRLFLNNNFQAS